MRSWHGKPDGFFSFEVVILIPQLPGEKRQLFVVAVTMYMYVVHKDKSNSNKVC